MLDVDLWLDLFDFQYSAMFDGYDEKCPVTCGVCIPQGQARLLATATSLKLARIFGGS